MRDNRRMRTIAVLLAAPVALTAATLPVLIGQGARASQFTPALADRADVKQATSYIDQHFDAQVAEWIHLTEIPALSTHEQQRAAYITGELTKLGLAPMADEIGNVMARCRRRADDRVCRAYGHRASDGYGPARQTAPGRNAPRARRLR